MKYYSPVQLKGEFGHVTECLFIKVMGLQMEDRSLLLWCLSQWPCCTGCHIVNFILWRQMQRAGNRTKPCIVVLGIPCVLGTWFQKLEVKFYLPWARSAIWHCQVHRLHLEVGCQYQGQVASYNHLCLTITPLGGPHRVECRHIIHVRFLIGLAYVDFWPPNPGVFLTSSMEVLETQISDAFMFHPEMSLSQPVPFPTNTRGG